MSSLTRMCSLLLTCPTHIHCHLLRSPLYFQLTNLWMLHTPRLCLLTMVQVPDAAHVWRFLLQLLPWFLLPCMLIMVNFSSKVCMAPPRARSVCMARPRALHPLLLRCMQSPELSRTHVQLRTPLRPSAERTRLWSCASPHACCPRMRDRLLCSLLLPARLQRCSETATKRPHACSTIVTTTTPAGAVPLVRRLRLLLIGLLTATCLPMSPLQQRCPQLRHHTTRKKLIGGGKTCRRTT
jgi:hypothetical protein